MPELTRVMTRTCISNISWSKKVEGTTGIHMVSFSVYDGWRCTCWGFRSHEHCKHVDEVSASGERCGWGEDAFANTIYHEKVCPNCGDETIPFYVGV